MQELFVSWAKMQMSLEQEFIHRGAWMRSVRFMATGLLDQDASNVQTWLLFSWWENVYPQGSMNVPDHFNVNLPVTLRFFTVYK